MRRAYAHNAIVVMDPGGDERAPGAAITVTLCGQWEHPPPCPLAPHHTTARRRGDVVRLRVLFAAEPAAEDEVRRRIEAALASSGLEGPDGATTRWQLRSAGSDPVRPAEAEHVERLMRNPDG